MDPVFLLVLVLLLAGNGLFVAAEFAVVGVPRTALEQQAGKGDAAAARVAALLRDPRALDRFIATCQLGITVASLGLGMYGERQLAGWLMPRLAATGAPAWLLSHSAAAGVALIALTYLHIVLGEIVPKAVALASPLRTARWIAPVILGLQYAVYPLVVGLNELGNLLLRLCGVERRYVGSHFSAEDLQYIVREAERGGTLRPEAAEVLDELIDFSELTAREVMVPRVKITGIEVGGSREQLVEVVTSHPHSRYPLYARDLDHIVGMIHVKDIAGRLVDGGGIRQADIRPVPFVPGSATLDTVLAAMREWRVQLAVVMDEHGGTDGIVTTEDLFEEVVGDIAEDGAERPDIYLGRDGALRVAGTVRVEEVGEHFDTPLEHEEIDTVSGLVLTLLARPPEVGDRVNYGGFEFEVTLVSGHGVTECRVVPLPEDGDAEH